MSGNPMNNPPGLENRRADSHRTDGCLPLMAYGEQHRCLSAHLAVRGFWSPVPSSGFSNGSLKPGFARREFSTSNSGKYVVMRTK